MLHWLIVIYDASFRVSGTYGRALTALIPAAAAAARACSGRFSPLAWSPPATLISVVNKILSPRLLPAFELLYHCIYAHGFRAMLTLSLIIACVQSERQ